MILKQLNKEEVMKKTLFIMSWVLLFVSCSDWLLAAASPTQGLVQGSIWVANEEGNSITVINAGQNNVAATLTGIAGPHNLQVSPDGKTVWVVSGHDSKAVMIDAATYKVHGAVQTGKHPAHIVVSPDGKRVYVTNAGDNTVSVIDVGSMKTVTEIPVGQYPHGLRPSPDGKYVYVATIKGNSVSVIDAIKNAKIVDIPVGEKPVQVAFSSDSRIAYVSLNGEDAVVKIDVEKQNVIGKVKVGIGPVQIFITPDNKHVLVANQGTEQQPSTTVSIIDTGNFSVTATVETGKGSHGVVIDPSGQYAYVTNIYGNDVSVIDLSTNKTIAKIPTEKKPNGISFSSFASPVSSTPIIQLIIEGMEMKH